MRYLIVFLLAGCASGPRTTTPADDVVPIGADTFMVTGRSMALGASANDVMLRLYRRANAHCGALGKAMEEVGSTSHGAGLARFPEGRLQFRCVAR